MRRQVCFQNKHFIARLIKFRDDREGSIANGEKCLSQSTHGIGSWCSLTREFKLHKV